MANASTNMRPRDWLKHFVLFVASCAGMYYTIRHFGPVVGAVALIILLKLGCLQFPLVLAYNLGMAVRQQAVTADTLRRSDMCVKPVTTKVSEAGEDARVRYGFSCMQGWRRSMEDAHSMVLDMSTIADSACKEAVAAGHGGAGDKSHSLFAVFDGHCGATVAQFCGKRIPGFLAASPAYKQGNHRDGLVECYVSADRYLKQHDTYRNDRSGCTAVTLLITETQLLCANAGDSRCVLCRSGAATPLSFDHKPHLPQEQLRIRRAGGFVFNRRLNGVLALSRAIGDFGFKNRANLPWEEQAVTCVPEVLAVNIDTHTDEFAVVACDGIWDVMTNDQVVAFVRQRIIKSRDVDLIRIAEELIDACMSPVPLALGCDNMSVIIVDLRKRD
jgi:serine/threonine protein phosphatase PrpC